MARPTDAPSCRTVSRARKDHHHPSRPGGHIFANVTLITPASQAPWLIAQPRGRQYPPEFSGKKFVGEGPAWQKFRKIWEWYACTMGGAGGGPSDFIAKGTGGGLRNRRRSTPELETMAARCNGFLARCGAVHGPQDDLAKGLAWHSGGIFKCHDLLPDGIKLMRAILGMTLLGLSWAIGMGMLVLALDDLLLGRLNLWFLWAGAVMAVTVELAEGAAARLFREPNPTPKSARPLPPRCPDGQPQRIT
jgi:hypothetical protein